MKTLIIRTDKLGDFYISLPYIKTIVDKYGKKNIDIIVSEKIYSHFKKKTYLFENLYAYPENGFSKKISLLRQLKNNHYTNIITFDGKDRSIIFASFLNSINKVVFIEKRKFNLLLKVLFKITKGSYKFVIDDRIKPYYILFNEILEILKIEFIKNKSQYLIHKSINSLDIYKHLTGKNNDYTLIHLDEKWFTRLYIQSFSEIAPTKDQFIIFIKTFLKTKNHNLFITTGLIKIDLLDQLIVNFFTKVYENFYVYKFNEYKVYLYTGASIEDLEVLTMNSKNLITCNGPLTQIAISFRIPVIDILEKNLEKWYDRHIHNKETYIKLYRKPFINLSEEIINKIK